MWTRAELKANAKMVLSRTIWTAVVVCLLAGILGGGGTGGGLAGSVTRRITDRSDQGQVHVYRLPGVGIVIENDSTPAIYGEAGGSSFEFRVPRVLPYILTVFAGGVTLIGLAWGIFLGGPAEAGKAYFFLQSRYQDPRVDMLFRNFGSGYYVNTVKTMLLRNLYIFLWSLLFIIPGIIKGYAYRMVPYLIAQNPHMSTSRALELSQRMTSGEKFNIFVLDLSFIGWAILAAIPCGLGYLILTPYMEATYAELFAALRVRALSEGYTTISEIGAP